MSCPKCSVNHFEQVVKCLVNKLKGSSPTREELGFATDLERARAESDLADPLTRIGFGHRAIADSLCEAIKPRFFQRTPQIQRTPNADCNGGARRAECGNAAHLANSVCAWLDGDLRCRACGSLDTRQPHCEDLPAIEALGPERGELLAYEERDMLCYDCYAGPDDMVVLSVRWHAIPLMESADQFYGVASIPVWTRWTANVCVPCSTKAVISGDHITGWDGAGEQIRFSDA